MPRILRLSAHLGHLRGKSEHVFSRDILLTEEAHASAGNEHREVADEVIGIGGLDQVEELEVGAKLPADGRGHLEMLDQMSRGREDEGTGRTVYFSKEPVYLSGSTRRDLPGVSVLGGEGPRSLRVCSCSVRAVWVAIGDMMSS